MWQIGNSVARVPYRGCDNSRIWQPLPPRYNRGRWSKDFATETEARAEYIRFD